MSETNERGSGEQERPIEARKSMTIKVTKHSSMRTVDRFYVGSIIEESGEYYRITSVATALDGHDGGYDHQITMVPATDDESAALRRTALVQSYRAAEMDPAATRRIENKIRAIDGLPALPDYVPPAAPSDEKKKATAASLAGQTPESPKWNRIAWLGNAYQSLDSLSHPMASMEWMAFIAQPIDAIRQALTEAAS